MADAPPDDLLVRRRAAVARGVAVALPLVVQESRKHPPATRRSTRRPGVSPCSTSTVDYRTVRRESIPPEENLLQPVFRNGKLLRKWDFTELIARSEREAPEYYYADVIAPMISGR